MLALQTNASEVYSDNQLTGYNVDVRRAVLSTRLGVSYSVRLFSTWSMLHISVRTGECDIAWAPFYLTRSRDRCVIDNVTCMPEAGISKATDLTPFRCCADFSVQYAPWSLAIMSRGSRQINFLEATSPM
jgi:hypothetical protein